MSSREVRRSSRPSGLSVMKCREATFRFCLVASCLLSQVVCVGDDRSTIRFNRDIRPILADKCFHCHGPDAATREANLRLDDEASVVGPRDGNEIIDSGDAEGSELYRRIMSTDESVRMPPVDSGRTLTDDERELLKRWIEQGADYQPHWAFVPAECLPPPNNGATSWPRNPIDNFVLRRLQSEGLTPSLEADRRTLIRRVTLDLTGLPPTPQEVQAFLDDAAPSAYEKLVDRLLASPRYGERMTVEWLDAARYADTHGYLFDTERSMWRWRDWVINAFNRNQPFDEFTLEQLAGDLLPDPSLDQLIATGFNRNHIINNEAGATPQEYLVENILDRVNTTSTVWMGLTIACAQCHDHKYDPVTQREYYELYAYFNNVPESGLDGFNENAEPHILAPTEEQRRLLAELAAQVRSAEEVLAPIMEKLAPAQAIWEAETRQPVDPVTVGLVVHIPFDENTSNVADPDAAIEFKDGMPTHEAGVFGQSAAMDGQRYVEMQSCEAIDFDIDTQFTFSAWVWLSDSDGRRGVFSKLEPPEAMYRGYSLQIVAGVPALYLVSSFPENTLAVQAKEPLEPLQWHHVVATYDGSSKAEGAKLYVDGKLQELSLTIDSLTSSFRNEKPLWIGNGHPGARFKGRIDDARIYNRTLTEAEIERLPGRGIQTLLAIDQADRSETVSRWIRHHYLEHAAPDRWRDLYKDVNRLDENRKEAERSLATVMVMDELAEPRQTTMLVRGAYDAPGAPVTASVPSVLGSIDPSLPKNRLGFARWLTDPEHPLTARVAVNRYWQMYFGTGLVRTSDDFGVQGEWPSHPELLDWLATRFIDSGWDVKAMQKLIVTSATYRQSSDRSPELLERDPHNRLLAHGPRHRLSAETIRDSALAVSGRLAERLGGASVRPYQPAGLWREVAFDVTGNNLTAQVYQQGTGDELFRRSMYTFWKRTSPPPTMLLFDGPDRERCVVRRERTNTPLQALVLMNDPTFVEAARSLAERILTEGGNTPTERISRGFELTLSRLPSAAELKPLMALLETQRERFQRDPDAAEQLLEVGDSAWDTSLPSDELAAYTVIANVLLNLDETVTKS